VPPINTAEEAINRADGFLMRYYPFKRPLSVRKDGNAWYLVYDVGVMSINKVQLTIDATTGAVLEYSDPRAA
jgi:hypothetical protein